MSCENLNGHEFENHVADILRSNHGVAKREKYVKHLYKKLQTDINFNVPIIPNCLFGCSYLFSVEGF